MLWNLGLWTQYAVGSPPVQAMESPGAIYSGNISYGLAQVYRLLGRSTWLDLLLRSGLLTANWFNVAVALALAVAVLVVALLALALYTRLPHLPPLPSSRRGGAAPSLRRDPRR